MVPVERIEQYTQNEIESEWIRKVNANPKIPIENWPNKGEIQFSNYSTRYREGLELVFDSIDIKIKGGEKIGIVRRTGAGKSSLALGLFRIVERTSGCIWIDRVRIDKIGLHELRQQLAIIPQDPILFSGTIRSNLDPFNRYSDKILWQALDHSHLSKYVTGQESGLESEVSENGSNLSLGQRQLLCLARALLLNTKILVLDEATAAIDLQTDSLIQRTIREQFSRCTVLTIAHQIETILYSDRVLVLEQGRVTEFDKPDTLLADSESKFYFLAKNARIL